MISDKWLFDVAQHVSGEVVALRLVEEVTELRGLLARAGVDIVAWKVSFGRLQIAHDKQIASILTLQRSIAYLRAQLGEHEKAAEHRARLAKGRSERQRKRQREARADANDRIEIVRVVDEP